MAFECGNLDSTFAAAAGDDPALMRELRDVFAESVERQLDLLRRSRCDANWEMAAQRLKGVAAGFNADACEQMKSMLAKPAIRHKFVAGLETGRPGSEIYRKSGTWRTYHSDSAIVERDGRRYIAVAMANHPSGGRWLSRIIVAMDDLIFSPANIAHDDSPDDHSDAVEAPPVSLTRT